MNSKELSEMKEQIKKEILDLDHQINELETYYIEDTKESGNILKGFQNYISAKTARNQSLTKKLKVENYQRLFSLSSIKCKTSETFEEFYVSEPIKTDSQNVAPKRNRARPSGMQKTSGKVVTGREIEIEEEDSDSEAAENPDYSNEDSSKNKGVSKKKKIVKSTIRKG